MDITEDIIKEYTVDKPPVHTNFAVVNALAAEMRVHIRGDKPVKILETIRPNEPVACKIYRLAVYRPITKSAMKKVIGILKRIRRADGWTVKPSDDSKADLFNKQISEGIRFHGSLETWLFETALVNCQIDPNGVFTVVPNKWDGEIKETERLEPQPIIFSCSEVLCFDLEKQLLAVRIANAHIYQYSDQTVTNRHVHYFYSENEIVKLIPTGNPIENKYDIKRFTHKLGYIPASYLGGDVLDTSQEGIVYESYLSGCVPFFDEAVRKYSDQQANITSHIHPERTELKYNYCKQCSGTGIGAGAGKPACGGCGGTGFAIGTGKMGKSALTTTEVDVLELPDELKDKMGDLFPSVRYAIKPVEPLLFMKEEIRDDIISGLSAINFEYVAEVPLNTSGNSKSYDRQEINGTLYTQACNLRRIYELEAEFILSLMYYNELESLDIPAFLPAVTVPVEFDAITGQQGVIEIEAANKAGMDSTILSALNEEWAYREFGGDHPNYQIIKLANTLDPYPNYKPADKLAMKVAGQMTDTDFIITTRINQLLRRIIERDPLFIDRDWDTQYQELSLEAQNIFADLQTSKLPTEQPILQENQESPSLIANENIGQNQVTQPRNPNQPQNYYFLRRNYTQFAK